MLAVMLLITSIFMWVVSCTILKGSNCALLNICFFPTAIQWSFGVTMWEVYSGGKLPYPGVTSSELIRHIASGGRLSKPENAACSDEV